MTLDVEHQLTRQPPSLSAYDYKYANASNLPGEDQTTSPSDSELSPGDSRTLGHSYGVLCPKGNTL